MSRPIIVFLFFILACNNNTPSPESISKPASAASVDTLPRTYDSLSVFLDSLFKSNEISYMIDKSFEIKKAISKISKPENYDMSERNLGLLKEVKFQHKSGNKNVYWDCFKFLQFENILFNMDTLYCWEDYKPIDKKYFSFGNSSFFTFKAGPSDDCIGSGCRGNSYAIISKTKDDIQLLSFGIPDDITGLKYGDINKDGDLDIMEVSNLIESDYLAQMGKDVTQYNIKDCTNMTCYTFNFKTFRNGKWERLKDTKGLDYFLTIRVDDLLNPDSSFRMFWSNLP